MIESISQQIGGSSKVLRFGAVSGFNVLFHQTVLYLGQQVFDIAPTWANIIAATLTAVPSFFIARIWVWNVQGSENMKVQAVVFWIIALLGLLVSTLVIWVAQRVTDVWFYFQLASFAGYFFVWIAKFFLLDRLFGEALTPSDVEITHEITNCWPTDEQ